MLVFWHGPQDNHCCLTKFQDFDIADHISPAPFTLIFTDFHYLFWEFPYAFSL